MIIGSEAIPASEVEARVLVRMGRRDVITRSNPVWLIALLGEAALHEMIGGPRVMADQLRHLVRPPSRPRSPFRSSGPPRAGIRD